MGREEGTSEWVGGQGRSPAVVSSTLPRSFSNSGLLAPKSWSFRELPILPSPAELFQDTPLTVPRAPLGCSSLLEVSTQEQSKRADQSLKPLGESLHGRREKPAPPQPGAPPHSLPSLSRSPSCSPSLPKLGVVPSPPSSSSFHIPAPLPPPSEQSHPNTEK